MKESFWARQRRLRYEYKVKFLKWIIRKATFRLDKLNEYAFMAYVFSGGEYIDYHLTAERFYPECHVYGTEIEYYDKN